VDARWRIAAGGHRTPELELRMVHSGPVSGVVDVNERTNVAGAGINCAAGVDCGDADTSCFPNVSPKIWIIWAWQTAPARPRRIRSQTRVRSTLLIFNRGSRQSPIAKKVPIRSRSHVPCALGGRRQRWSRFAASSRALHILALSRAIDAGCTWKKHRGASFRQPKSRPRTLTSAKYSGES